jgi:hypothetical protein
MDAGTWVILGSKSNKKKAALLRLFYLGLPP